MHTEPRSRALHVTLWVVQLLLAAFFVMAGINHGLNPIAEAAQSSPWITGIPAWLARFIGFAELAGAAGLILPAATRIKPWLTPLAAAGLAVVMLLAAAFHVTRGEDGQVLLRDADRAGDDGEDLLVLAQLHGCGVEADGGEQDGDDDERDEHGCPSDRVDGVALRDEAGVDAAAEGRYESSLRTCGNTWVPSSSMARR